MRVETLAATLARTIVAAHALSCGFVCNVPVATLGTQQPSWGQCFSVHQLSPEPGQGVIIFRQVSTGVFEAVWLPSDLKINNGDHIRGGAVDLLFQAVSDRVLRDGCTQYARRDSLLLIH